MSDAPHINQDAGGDAIGGNQVIAGRDAAGRDIITNNYYVPQSPPAPPMPLDQALALLASLPDGENAPIPSPDAFQVSTVPRLMSLTPNELFVGRDADLRTVARQLKAGASVVITTGMGGVGKTQLAIELAHRYGRYFGGGVFWLDASSPERLEDSIAACGQALIRDPEFGKQPRAEQLRQVQAVWAEALPRLLIFDNDEDPALLRQHRPASGGCCILVTARNQVWPAGERLAPYALEVLSRGASVRLLRALAGRLTEAEADGIAEELGDLPLALHLAGSFLASASSRDPAVFRERVRERRVDHPVLSSRPDGPEVSAPTDAQQRREAGLRAVFQISLGQLDPDDPVDALARTLLARAAGLKLPGWPFPRAFLIETAPAPEQADPDLPSPAEAAVRRLLQLGLLEAEGETRLRLHRLLAAFAWEALDGPGAFASFAPAALTWVVRLVDRATDLWPVRDVEGRAWLDQERPLWEQFLDWGYVHEMGEGTCQSARATVWLGNYWVISGAQGQAATLEWLQQALAAAQRCADPDAQANTLRALGDVQQFQDEREAALGSYRAALELFRATGSSLGEANTRKAIGDVQRLQGEGEAALGSYRAALELYRATGSRQGEANTRKAIGDVQQFKKEGEAALGSYRAALELYRATGERVGEANTLRAIGDAQQFQGAGEAALGSYAAALELYRATGSRQGEANTLFAIGDAQQFQGAGEAALGSYAAALELFRAIGSRLGEANVLAAQSRLWLDHDPARSQAALEAALRLRRAIDDGYGEGSDLGNYGVVLLQCGRAAEALPYLQRAHAIFVAHGLTAQVQQVEQMIAGAQQQHRPPEKNLKSSTSDPWAGQGGKQGKTQK